MIKPKWIKGLICLAGVSCILISGCAAEKVAGPANSEAGIEAESQTAGQQESQQESLTGEDTQESLPLEPVVTTVTISATGDCTLGVTQTHGN